MRKIVEKEEFERLWNESTALICDFSASWCGPCQMLGPILKKIERENPSIMFIKVDIDEVPELSGRYRVEAVPTLLFVRKGRVVKRIVGLESYDVLSKQTKELAGSGGI